MGVPSPGGGRTGRRRVVEGWCKGGDSNIELFPLAKSDPVIYTSNIYQTGGGVRENR